jgi:hypothetical protein
VIARGCLGRSLYGRDTRGHEDETRQGSTFSASRRENLDVRTSDMGDQEMCASTTYLGSAIVLLEVLTA